MASAVLLTTGLAGGVLTASAEERTYTAILTDGSTIPLTLDVEPGTPLTELELPAAIADLVYSVSDGTDTVLAQDLPRAQDDAGEPEPSQPGKGRGLSNTESPLEGSGAGTGKRLKPSADSLAKARKRKSREDGRPDPNNPTYSYALPGPTPIGVPNFFIDRFRIPPFLLPIYQAAGIEYGVRWEVLAAINEIETDYGRNVNVSSAGALGWMQFMPSSWKAYGVDANDDGEKDPYNPVDAIFAAARYLRAAGAEQDLRKAVFAYNHADWYVDSVLLRAKVIGGFPTDLVGSLTGLTQGRFPVDAIATYAGAVQGGKRAKAGDKVAETIEGTPGRRSIRIFADAGSKVIAVHDGKIVEMGEDDERGRFIRLRDVFGNTYMYSGLGTIAKTHKVRGGDEAGPEKVAARAAPLFSEPAAPASIDLLATDEPAPSDAPAETAEDDGLRTDELKTGSTVNAGTVLGEIGRTTELAPHLAFSIKPAGRGAPRIDPKPILDGWKLLETTAIYRAKGKDPFYGPDAAQPTIGQILLMSKATLSDRVLNDPRIDVYECGRRDIEAGVVDRRILATLEFLATSGFEPGVTSLRCGHNRLTTSGRVSFHSSGDGVDISTINGTPILGHQGPGSITDETVRKLLTLQAAMKPAEIITLAEYSGTDNTYAMADHDDHIHVGFEPLSDRKLAQRRDSALKPGQWSRLMQRLNQIDNPSVPTRPSEFAITVTKPAAKKSAERAD